MSQAFASADIFLMPSDSETLGFVVLEAMASGIGVVASAAGGLVDIVQHESTGFLAENNDDAIEFTKYATELLQNVDKRQTFEAAARKWAEGWSWESATAKLRNIQYPKAIENHRKKQELRKQQQAAADEEACAFFDEMADVYRPDFAM